MAIHFRTDHEQLRPLGRATRGESDETAWNELIGMDILPVQFLPPLPQYWKQRLRDWRGSEATPSISRQFGRNLTTVEADITEDIETEDETEDIETEDALQNSPGPWVLNHGWLRQKRVPVAQFNCTIRDVKGR